PDIISGSTTSDFLSYKSYIENYVQQNPSFTGTVPNGGFSSTLHNMVFNDNHTASIIMWLPNAANQVDDTTAQSQNNKTIGYTLNDHWFTKSLGDMGTIPNSVPNGSLVSVVMMTGNGY
uniref:type IV pilus biogenesis protein PilM n=1 Tax=Neokomagataea TaxID=1223423 RepID=UPI00082EC4F3